MKKIYIILTHTGTNLSKLIKSYTKDEFSHVSIALDLELQQMYSFGRLNPYNPIWGGFVHEHRDKGTFKRFYLTTAKVYQLEVTEAQYETMKDKIYKMEAEKKQYTFNILGLFAAGFRKKIKGKKSFYCAEFVKYILDQAKVKIELPEVPKPEDFKKIDQLKEIYSGLLKEYDISNRTSKE
ncbi:MAG: hypothetical protein HFJ33_04410 [Clostridia bacterium]|nr:hypothetical protein [Clostridia bacterium]